MHKIRVVEDDNDVNRDAFPPPELPNAHSRCFPAEGASKRLRSAPKRHTPTKWHTGKQYPERHLSYGGCCRVVTLAVP